MTKTALCGALSSVTPEQRLLIATFGSTQEEPKVRPIVKIGMAGKGYPPMQLSLYVVPMICEPLVSQPISACARGNQTPCLTGSGRLL